MRHAPKALKVVVVPAIVALLAVGCGGGDDETSATPTLVPSATAQAPTATVPRATATAIPPTPAPTPTPEGFYLPDTPVAALMLDGYAVRDAEEITYLTTDLPIIAGTAAAFWYQAMGRYVVVFDGLDLAATGPICPGASIETDGGFAYVSNGPTAAGACDGAPTLAQTPAGPYICDGFLAYVTEIPAGTEGSLYGTLETYDDGTIYGITSRTRGDASTAPEIDMTECEPLS